MELSEVKKVKVGDQEFPVKFTNRSVIEYENLSGGSISDLAGTERLIKFFYCTAKAGAKAEGVEFKYTFDEFLDVIDDYYIDTITNFSKVIFAEPGGGEKKRAKSSK